VAESKREMPANSVELGLQARCMLKHVGDVTAGFGKLLVRSGEPAGIVGRLTTRSVFRKQLPPRRIEARSEVRRIALTEHSA